MSVHSNSSLAAEPIANHDNKDNKDGDAKLLPAQKRGVRFWLIIVSLAATGLLTAIEATVVSTALPTIVGDLGGGEQYVWVVMAYFLTSTAFQPLFGQLADIFGRRYPIIISVAIYVLGSGICGGAYNIGMLVAGRTIQGLGGAGINVLCETVVCDIVPLRERGNFMAIIFGSIALGTALGPLFGGLIVQYSNWRWVFYLNLPIGGVALIFLTLFLRVHRDRTPTIMEKLKKIDYLGNGIFIGSCISALISLSWAGTIYEWSSFRIILPLVLGLLGFGAFLFYEKFAVEPMMPPHLFMNRTSFIAFLLTFFHGIGTIYVLYFIPVYFQAVLMSTPARSGVQLLPTILFMLPAAALGGALVAKIGQFIHLHLVGFALMVLGFGLFSRLDADSTTAEWVIYQGIEAIGAGILVSTLLPAVQAKLSEADVAKSTATWGFVRAFGLVWGTAIPTTIFNNRFDQLAIRIKDANVRTILSHGHAYEHATRDFLLTLPKDIQKQVIDVFSDSMKRTWQIGIAFLAVGFLLVFLEQKVDLRTTLVTEFGLVDEKKKGDKEQGLPEPVKEETSVPVEHTLKEGALNPAQNE